jgi:hypothetical protein
MYYSKSTCADVNQRPRTNITNMANAGGNCPLAPHMRPFVPCRCIGLIEEDPPSKPIHFLLGLRGSMTQRRDGGAMREVAKRETAAQRER